MTRLFYALAQSELPPPSGPPQRGMAVTGADIGAAMPPLAAVVILALLAGLMFWLAHREAKL